MVTMSSVDDTLKRIKAMEAVPGEPEWISLDIFDIPWSEGVNPDDAIRDIYYEVEEAFEKMVEAVDAHFGPNDPDLADEVPTELLDGLKEPYFWILPEGRTIHLGTIGDVGKVVAGRVGEGAALVGAEGAAATLAFHVERDGDGADKDREHVYGVFAQGGPSAITVDVEVSRPAIWTLASKYVHAEPLTLINLPRHESARQSMA